jgi:large subunit ribosomal protein L7/L12
VEKIMASKSYEKLIDEIGSLSLSELAAMIEGIQEKFGISAVMPVAGPAAGAAEQAPAAEEKSEFKVTLADAGANKINVIKALRTVTTLTLGDAKKAVDEAPTVLGESVGKDEAKKMKEVLEAAGAKVQLA